MRLLSRSVSERVPERGWMTENHLNELGMGHPTLSWRVPRFQQKSHELLRTSWKGLWISDVSCETFPAEILFHHGEGPESQYSKVCFFDVSPLYPKGNDPIWLAQIFQMGCRCWSHPVVIQFACFNSHQKFPEKKKEASWMATQRYLLSREKTHTSETPKQRPENVHKFDQKLSQLPAWGATNSPCLSGLFRLVKVLVCMYSPRTEPKLYPICWKS